MRKLTLAFVALIVVPAVAVFYGGVLGPTPLGYVNKLYPPNPVPLALNPPQFDFIPILQKHHETFRDEFHSRREAALRPRSDFSSKEFPGALGGLAKEEAVGWNTLYLRLGTQDMCLTEYFPKTMAILDKELGTRVHTIFFSELQPGKEAIAPHCGQLSGLHRVITVLAGEKQDGETSLASMGAYDDNEMCLTRFTKHCPVGINVTDQTPDAKKLRLVHYNVGDVIVFNDFVCHWVKNKAKGPRLVMVINVDRPDVASFSNFLTAWGSWIFSRKSLAVFREQSQKACDRLKV